jgi:hypothetical protein
MEVIARSLRRLRGIAEANSEPAVQKIQEPSSTSMDKRFLAALGTGSAISSIFLKISAVKGMRLLRFARNDIVAQD